METLYSHFNRQFFASTLDGSIWMSPNSSTFPPFFFQKPNPNTFRARSDLEPRMLNDDAPYLAFTPLSPSFSSPLLVRLNLLGFEYPVVFNDRTQKYSLGPDLIGRWAR